MSFEALFPYLFLWVVLSIMIGIPFMTEVVENRGKFTTRGQVVLALIFLPVTFLWALTKLLGMLVPYVLRFFLKKEVLEEVEGEHDAS